MKSALDFVAQFFLEVMLVDMSEWGNKKISGGWGGNLPWMMPCDDRLRFYYE